MIWKRDLVYMSHVIDFHGRENVDYLAYLRYIQSQQEVTGAENAFIAKMKGKTKQIVFGWDPSREYARPLRVNRTFDQDTITFMEQFLHRCVPQQSEEADRELIKMALRYFALPEKKKDIDDIYDLYGDPDEVHEEFMEWIHRHPNVQINNLDLFVDPEWF